MGRGTARPSWERLSRLIAFLPGISPIVIPDGQSRSGTQDNPPAGALDTVFPGPGLTASLRPG